MLYQVILANKESIIEGDLINYLANYSTMPNYMLNYLKTSLNSKDAKMILDEQLKELTEEINKTQALLSRSEYQFGTWQSNKTILELDKTPLAHQELIDNLIIKGQFAQANEQLNIFSLRTDVDLNEQLASVAYFNLKHAIYNRASTWDKASNSEKVQLDNIINTYPLTKASAILRGIKCYYFKLCDLPLLDMVRPSMASKSNKVEAESMEEVDATVIKVYPIPASKFISFELQQEALINCDKVLKLYDSKGICIYTIDLKSGNFLQDIDVSNYLSGSYFYRLITPFKEFSGNFTISR
jgi:hypothetical protein